MGRGIWLNPKRNQWIDVQPYGIGRHEFAASDHAFQEEIGLGEEYCKQINEIAAKGTIREDQDRIRIIAIEGGLIRMRECRRRITAEFIVNSEEGMIRNLKAIDQALDEAYGRKQGNTKSILIRNLQPLDQGDYGYKEFPELLAETPALLKWE